MSFYGAREQARADAEPRMREPVEKQAWCSRCGKLTSYFEQDFATGEAVCMDCVPGDDLDAEEESDE